jgi:hypothetical protein
MAVCHGTPPDLDPEAVSGRPGVTTMAPPVTSHEQQHDELPGPQWPSSGALVVLVCPRSVKTRAEWRHHRLSRLGTQGGRTGARRPEG